MSGHSVSYKTACAPSEDSDQPENAHISRQNLCCPSKESQDIWLPIERKAMTDQPAQLRRLIRVIAWSTCDLVGNAVARLIFYL